MAKACAYLCRRC